MSSYNSSIVTPIADPMFKGGFRYDVRIVEFDRDDNIQFSFERSTYSMRHLFNRLRERSRSMLLGSYISVFAPSPSGFGEVCIWTSPRSGY